MIRQKGTRPSIGSTPEQTLEQTHATAVAITGSVKNAEDAKTYLQTKGWVIAGEAISLETLARTLFATVLEQKIPTRTANAITAVAFLLTEQLEESVTQEVASSLVKHIRETISTLTTQEVANTINEQLTVPFREITEGIQKKMDDHTRAIEESTQKTITQVRTYSQIAATATAPAPPTTPTPAISRSQIQIQNREQIKKRQVLINFSKTDELNLDMMNEATLSRKAADSLRTTWATTTSPKPTVVKLKLATLLRNGGLLLELDSPETAQWLRNETITAKFLEGIGSGASIKNRTYQVIVSFAPIQFNPEDDEQVRECEERNDIQRDSIIKAEWIKPITERRLGQKVATLRMYHKDAKSANSILKNGAHILNKRVEPKRPRKEPIRCLKCQRFGHERRDCKDEHPTCAKCAGKHETNECRASREYHFCTNCRRPHPSYSRDCNTFREKCKQMDQRCPENTLAFYPTDEKWTWVIEDQTFIPQPPPPPPRLPAPHPLAEGRQPMRQTVLSGGNDTPLGANLNHYRETHNDHSQ